VLTAATCHISYHRAGTTVILEQTTWSATGGWAPSRPGAIQARFQLVLVFGERVALATPGLLDEIAGAYPGAHVVGCSTAGEINGIRVQDESVVVTAVSFRSARIAVAIAAMENLSSEEAGAALAARLSTMAGLCHVLVLSDGLHVNGSELVRGLTRGLPPNVPVTGGLAGDGAAFASTVVVHGAELRDRIVIAVGFAGEGLRIGYGSVGGWDPFGPERVVTRAVGNVLYELDGQSALALYRRYLGEEARHLPASGLLFPLSIRQDRTERGVVRTILSVNDAEQSLTFAGDIPTGARAQLMRADFDRLVEGASGAARISMSAQADARPSLALLISCVGRKMVLKQRIEEEVEAVQDVVGGSAVLAGFYSYGEISPFSPDAKCELHNQTMTVTTWSED
jgi:hypothetical protein